MGPLTRTAAIAISLLLLTAGDAAAQATSQTFTVNTTADGVDFSLNGVCSTGALTGGPCTLRAAIQEANQGGPDTVLLPPGTYQLTLAGPGEDNAAGGDLDINQPVTINGGGARTTIVQQSPSVPDRVFEVRTTFGQVTLNALTITGGGLTTGNGAGLRNTGPATRLTASAVRGNNGGTSSPGGGIENGIGGNLTVDSSLVTANTTNATQGGGGIFNSGGTLTVVNSTISGNGAATGSAIQDAGSTPTTNVQYSTITGNTSSAGAAVQRGTSGGLLVFRDSIVGPNGGTGTNCTGTIATEGHNIETGTNCNFNDAAGGDRQQLDPGVGPLAYSSANDQTETHPLQPGSPAINAASNAGCPATDQRAQPRPAAGTCDIGAFEDQPVPPPPPAPRPAILLFDPPSATRTPGDANTVTATVRNDNGTPAAGVSVRYEITGANPSEGAVTTDASGAARISWDGVHEGTDTLKAFVDGNGNLTSDPGEPTGQASVVWALPEPAQGKTANIEPVSGRVRITVKGSSGKVGAAGSTRQLLTEARQVPLATVVDVRRGRVRMTTSANKAGDVQKGEFYGGVYTTRQSATSTRPVTELRMSETLVCQSSSRRGKLTAARARSRHLWGNARGRYRTRGRYSTATVRGTIWIQKDSCNTTTTAVRQGVVIVKDLVKRRNVRVKAGKRYVARKSSRRRR